MEEFRLSIPTYNASLFSDQVAAGTVPEFGPPYVPVVIREAEGVESFSARMIMTACTLRISKSSAAQEGGPSSCILSAGAMLVATSISSMTDAASSCLKMGSAQLLQSKSSITLIKCRTWMHPDIHHLPVSRIMAAVRSPQNQSTELRLIALFRQLRITGWRRRYPLFGNPDFTFPQQKLARSFHLVTVSPGHSCHVPPRHTPRLPPPLLRAKTPPQPRPRPPRLPPPPRPRLACRPHLGTRPHQPPRLPALARRLRRLLPRK